MTTRRHASLAVPLVAFAACNQSPLPDLDLERMIHQQKYLPYESSDFFADGKAMRAPPAGAGAYDRVTVDPARGRGLGDGRSVGPIPFGGRQPVAWRGRAPSEIFLFPSHGVA